jgi:tetratricopeptide (TPR) repeat protein
VLQRLLEQRPDALVRDQVLMLLVRTLRRQGRPDEAERWLEQRGCPVVWTVAGPEHDFAHADLTRPFSLREGHALPSRDCKVRLQSERPGGGVYLMAVEVEADRAGPAVLTVQTTSPWQLLLGDAVIYTHDPSDRRPARQTRLRLAWPAGRQRLALKVGADGGYAAVGAALTPEGDGHIFRFRPAEGGLPGRTGARVAVPLPMGCGPSPEEFMGRAGWPFWYAPVAEQLAAEQALDCGDFDGAYRHLGLAQSLAPAYLGSQLVRVGALLDDPAVPDRVAADRSAEILRDVLRHDDALGWAAFHLGLMASRMEKTDEALRLFLDGTRRWNGDFRHFMGLQRIYHDRSYRAEEQAALEEALRREPEACALLEDLVSVKLARRDVAGMEPLAERACRCSATSEAWARSLRDRGRKAEALAEYRRLLRLTPGSLALRREVVSLLSLLGRQREAEAEQRGILAEHPGSSADLVRLSDLLAGAGERDRALALLRQAQEHMPWQTEVRQTLERLEGRSVLETYRRDGRAVIAEFQRRGKSYDAPAVLVQDRMVARIYENGGRLNLTHNIVQVLTKEGVERWGEVRLPHGAEILTLRTVKADGAVREPEEVGGKQSVSVPDLEMGDFVEMEYLESEAPLRALTSANSQRFFFGSFDVPLVLSEYLVLAPAKLPLVVESRGSAPRPEETKDGDLIALRFAIRDRDRLVLEPRSVTPEEYMASVKVATERSWDRVQAYLADKASWAFQPSWPLAEIVRQRTSGARSPRERAQALYREVLDRVDAAGPSLSSAAQAVARGAGSRHSVLVAMLRTAGIPAELWMVKPVVGDQGPRRVADMGGFTAPLVYCPLSEGPVFLDPQDPAVPFAYVEPELRGGQALRAAPGGDPLVRVPEQLAGNEDAREVDVDLRLERDGDARVQVKERLLGQSALMLRAMTRRLEVTRLTKLFEHSMLGFHFPGAVLERLGFQNEKNTALPLELNYVFRTRQLTRREQGGFQLKLGLFAPQLAGVYLGLSRRQRALQVAFHTPALVRLHVRTPAGLVLDSLPPPVDLRSEFGSLSRRTWRGEGGSLEARTEIKVASLRRVSPEDYARFTRFALQVDAEFKVEARYSVSPSR